MRWCSRQDRTSALILFRACLLIAGKNALNCCPVLVPRSSLPELVPQVRKGRVLVRAASLPVLAVDDPGLVGMQPQPDLLHPVADRGQHLACLQLADTVHDRVIDVALERDARKFPSHPRVERIVQEQIREHGRDRRSLRSAAIPRRQRPVDLLQRRV